MSTSYILKNLSATQDTQKVVACGTLESILKVAKNVVENKVQSGYSRPDLQAMRCDIDEDGKVTFEIQPITVTMKYDVTVAPSAIEDSHAE